MADDDGHVGDDHSVRTAKLTGPRYTTPLCICHDLEALAAAAFHMAYKAISQLPPLQEQVFIDTFGVEGEEEMKEITKYMTDWYTKSRNSETYREAASALFEVRGDVFPDRVLRTEQQPSQPSEVAVNGA